jgi:hypothetical protein
LEEASTYGIWFQLLIHELQVTSVQRNNLRNRPSTPHTSHTTTTTTPTTAAPPPPPPIPIYQDNKSTIIIATNGGNFKRTKHLLVKDSYLKERITEGDITLKYLSTDRMPADILTKATSSTILSKHLQFLCLTPPLSTP